MLLIFNMIHFKLIHVRIYSCTAKYAQCVKIIAEINVFKKFQ